MTWLHVYASVVTVLALVCGFGWYLSHGVLVALRDVEASDWPMIQKMLKGRV